MKKFVLKVVSYALRPFDRLYFSLYVIATKSHTYVIPEWHGVCMVTGCLFALLLGLCMPLRSLLVALPFEVFAVALCVLYYWSFGALENHYRLRHDVIMRKYNATHAKAWKCWATAVLYLLFLAAYLFAMAKLAYAIA